MPLYLPSLTFAIKCDANELEMFDVKQDGPSLVTAFVASEAGKQFRISFMNNLWDCDVSLELRIDGKVLHRSYIRAQQRGQILGIYRGSNSVLPFKFQQLELVDPDLEDAPLVPEMGTIELRAFRSRSRHIVAHVPDPNYGVHEGRVSERSKKAGWHHVGTADEMPIDGPTYAVVADNIDPSDAPCAFFKVFYRPRELLMAQGVIPGHVTAAESRGESRVNDRKRTREDGSPGPSERRPRLSVKKEEVCAQRIRSLQAELRSLMAEQSSSSVKCELRSPSPIVVGQAAGEVVDLTLEE